MGLGQSALTHNPYPSIAYAKGGATAVYNSASAKDEDIKSHGTWTSSAWRIYAQRDPEKSSVVSALKKLSV